MRKIEELIKNVKDDMAYYGKTIDMRSMNDIPVNGMPEKYKECERLLEILEAEREGRLVVLPCKVGDTENNFEYGMLPHKRYIGKTIFFTRESAEAARKEQSDET